MTTCLLQLQVHSPKAVKYYETQLAVFLCYFLICLRQNQSNWDQIHNNFDTN